MCVSVCMFVKFGYEFSDYIIGDWYSPINLNLKLINFNLFHLLVKKSG